MTESQPALRPAAPPWRSQSYPKRVHVRERPQWQELLANWDERIAAARGALLAAPTGPNRAELDRIAVQMAGARDQIAEAVRRLPMEVGDLYQLDKERVDEAVRALERLFARWDALRT